MRMTNSRFKEQAKTIPRLQANTNSNIKPNCPLSNLQVQLGTNHHKEKETAHGTNNGQVRK